jgi:sugar lactone lactonase YvrE
MSAQHWKFELVAGPYQGPAGGVIWHDDAILFSVIDEGLILRFDPESKAVTEFRRYANRVNGLAHGPGGELYGAQEGGRRLVEFTPDGRLVAVDARLDGKFHNQPCDLVVDKAHRIWFADPRHAIIPFGPAIFPYLDHASVLRLARNDRRAWVATRVTYDTQSPRAVLLSPDETTLYVADGDPSTGASCAPIPSAPTVASARRACFTPLAQTIAGRTAASKACASTAKAISSPVPAGSAAGRGR